MRKFVGLGLVLSAAVGAGAAAAEPSVEIDHAVARVTVIPEARSDIAVFVVKANARFPLKVTRAGDVTTIEGPLGWRSASCNSLIGHPRVTVWGLGGVGYDDMPQVVIRTPRNVKVAAGSAVFGVIGQGDNIELANSGCGDWKVADQTGMLRLRLAGSGDVRAGSVGSADFRVSGSADINMLTVRNGLSAAIGGSGDVIAATVNGPLRARVGGSGDVRIHGGAVTDMDVAVAGSGDVKFGGVARSLEARIAGSGDVSVAKVTGPVSKQVAGSGDVTVGR